MRCLIRAGTVLYTYLQRVNAVRGVRILMMGEFVRISVSTYLGVNAMKWAFLFVREAWLVLWRNTCYHVDQTEDN